MDFSEAYLNRISEYSSSLKSKDLPLLSWDIHLCNISSLTKQQQDINFIKKFEKNHQVEPNLFNEYIQNKLVLIVTDLNFNIEYASNNMLEMTGYFPREVIGKTPKIFQGPKTDLLKSKAIRKAVEKRNNFKSIIVNYRKDNSLYDCQIEGYPVYDKKKSVVKYIALEKVA